MNVYRYMRYLLPLLMVPVLLIAFQAHAQEPRMCTMQYAPVCGAQPVQCAAEPCYPQYKTYGNSCTMSAEGGTFIHEGECTDAESGPVIPEEETVLNIRPEHTEVAVQVMEELATVSPPIHNGFWENLFVTIKGWFSWMS